GRGRPEVGKTQPRRGAVSATRKTAAPDVGPVPPHSAASPPPRSAHQRGQNQAHAPNNSSEPSARLPVCGDTRADRRRYARPLILGLITLRWGRFITLKAACRLGGRD